MSERPVNPDSQAGRMLELLSDGRAHSHLELARIGVGRPNNRRRDLVKAGYDVTCTPERDSLTSQRVYVYRLVGRPGDGAPDSSGRSSEAELLDPEPAVAESAGLPRPEVAGSIPAARSSFVDDIPLPPLDVPGVVLLLERNGWAEVDELGHESQESLFEAA